MKPTTTQTENENDLARGPRVRYTKGATNSVA